MESINKYEKHLKTKNMRHADILVKCLKAISNFEARHGNEIDESINRIISHHMRFDKDSIDASIKIMNGPSYHTSKVGKMESTQPKYHREQHYNMHYTRRLI